MTGLGTTVGSCKNSRLSRSVSSGHSWPRPHRVSLLCLSALILPPGYFSHRARYGTVLLYIFLHMLLPAGPSAQHLSIETARKKSSGPSESQFSAPAALHRYAWWNVQDLCNLLADGGSKFSSPPAVHWSRRRAEMALEIELESDGTMGGCSTPWLFNPVASYFLPVALRWILLSLLDLTTASVWILCAFEHAD